MTHSPDPNPLSHLLFVSTSTYPLGHVSDLEIFRSAARHNTTNNITGVILRGETWFCQVLEGQKPQLEATWNRINQDARHVCLTHWWQQGSSQKLFGNWHTEHWGVSPQIEKLFVDMMRSDRIMTPDKIILVRAFAQVRRTHSAKQRSGVKNPCDARFDSSHLSQAINIF